MKSLNVQLLLTGNELMSGDVIDSNSAMIAQYFKELGIEIRKKVTIGDNLFDLTTEIANLTATADILIINGGLGPTSDDKTAEAVSMVTLKPLTEHSAALEHIKTWCQHKKISLSLPNLKQAILPQDCHIIANEVGSAVGFTLIHNNCEILCTPGVPSELKIMLSQEIIPTLRAKLPSDKPTKITRLHVFGIGESSLQQLLNEHFPNWPEDIELGYRAEIPMVEIKLITRSTSAFLRQEIWLARLKKLLGDHIVYEIDQQVISMAEHVLKLLTAKKLKITTAESCTGGLIASQLTNIAGSSLAFEAGFVTYSNEMKSLMLAVDPNIIEHHGAVSKATAIAMAQGALNKSNADVVIAVTGIAGPSGGSEEKPVGSVWIAWGTKAKIDSQYFCLTGDRTYFQQMVTARGFDLIRRLLIGSSEIPFYIKNFPS